MERQAITEDLPPSLAPAFEAMAQTLQSLGEGRRMDRRSFMGGFALVGALAGLARHPNLRAGFCHNNDMAMAALRSVQKAGKQAQVVIGGINGMQPACAAVQRGELMATAINPTGRIHGGAVWIGYYLATRGDGESVPKFIRMDGGIVNAENAAGYFWLGDHLMI